MPLIVRHSQKSGGRVGKFEQFDRTYRFSRYSKPTSEWMGNVGILTKPTLIESDLIQRE